MPHRLAAVEWAFVADQAYVSETRFGRFVNHPQFRTLRDAHQLFDCRCAAHEVEALLAEVERFHAEAKLPYRTIATTDPDTAGVLARALPLHGWVEQPMTHVMVFRAKPQRSGNSAVRIVEVNDATNHDWVSLLESERPLHPSAQYNDDYAAFARIQDVQFGSRAYLGYLDGELAGTTGYYLVDGIARYRSVITSRPFRGRSVASTLIRHVQNQPAVRAAEALTIAVLDTGPRPLYESLGFTSAAFLWRFFK